MEKREAREIQDAYSRDLGVIMHYGKEAPIPPKISSTAYGWGRVVTCRRCGRTVASEDDRYCSGCGQKILHCRTAKIAEERWKKLCEEAAATV